MSKHFAQRLLVLFSSIACPLPTLLAQCGFLWQPLGNGVGGIGNTVNAIAPFPDGSIIAYAQGLVPSFVRWNGSAWSFFGSTDAPINALLRLTNGQLVAGFTMTATGFPTAAIAARMIGSASAATPLSSVHPAGQLGCNLLVNADILFDLALPSSGAVTLTVPLPNSATLIALTAFAQVASIELGASGAITSVLASNGQSFVVGTF